MNKSQAKDTRMFAATDECMNQNQVKWTNILAISLIKDKLVQNMVNIKELDQKKSSSVSTPVTTNKEKTKELLEESIEILAGIVSSYAEAKGLKEIAQKVKLLTQSFAKKRETDIEPKVNAFLKLVRELMPELSDYALTEAMVVEAETLRNQLVAMIGSPRNLTVQGSSANKQVDTLITETKNLLSKQLDGLMLRFRTTESEFYNSYLQARTIVEPATHHKDKPDGTNPAT
jgi:hypothetical protein